MIILRTAITGTAPHGREGYYFGASGQYRLLDAARAYTGALYKLGKSADPEPITYAKEEIDKYLGGVCCIFILIMSDINVHERTERVSWFELEVQSRACEGTRMEAHQNHRGFLCLHTYGGGSHRTGSVQSSRFLIRKDKESILEGRVYGADKTGK